MKKRVSLYRIICFVLIALTIVALALTFAIEAPKIGIRLAIHICILLAAACSFIYILLGARKKDAYWFMAFEIFLSASTFLATLRAIQMGHSIWSIAFYILSFAAISVFIFAKNLGKNKSIILCAFFTISQIAAMIIQTTNNFSLTRTLGVISNVIMAVLLLFMLELKYIDKESRKINE